MRPMIDGHVLQHVAESFAGIVSVEPDPLRSELKTESVCYFSFSFYFFNFVFFAMYSADVFGVYRVFSLDDAAIHILSPTRRLGTKFGCAGIKFLQRYFNGIR